MVKSVVPYPIDTPSPKNTLVSFLTQAGGTPAEGNWGGSGVTSQRGNFTHVLSIASTIIFSGPRPSNDDHLPMHVLGTS